MAWLRSAVGMLLVLSACQTFSDAEVTETGGAAGGSAAGGAGAGGATGGAGAGGATGGASGGGLSGVSGAAVSGSSGQGSGGQAGSGGQSGGGQAGSGAGAIRVLLLGGRTTPGSPGTIPAAGGFPSACVASPTDGVNGEPGPASDAGGAPGFPVPYAAGKGGVGGVIAPDIEGGAAGAAGSSAAGMAGVGGGSGGAGAGGASAGGGGAGSGGASGAGSAGMSGGSGQTGAGGAAAGAGGASGGQAGAGAGGAGAGGAGASGAGAGGAGAGGAGAGGAGAGGMAGGAATDPNPYPSTKCIEEVVLTAQGNAAYTGQIAYSSQTELAKPLSMFAAARLGGSSWALSGGMTGKVASLNSTCPYCFDLIEPASFSTLNEGVTTYRDEGNASVLDATSSYGMSVSWSVDVPGGGKMLVVAGTAAAGGPTQCQYRLFADPSKPEAGSAPEMCSDEGTVPFRRGASTVVVPRLDASGQVANDGGPYGWLLLLAGKGEKADDQAQYGQTSKGTGVVEHSIHYAPIGASGPGAWAAADRELLLPALKNVGTVSSYSFYLNTGIVGASAFHEPTAGLVHVAGGCFSALYVHDSSTRAYVQGAAPSVQSFSVTEGAKGELVFGEVSEQALPVNRCYAASAVAGSSMLLFGGVVIGESEPGGKLVNLTFEPLDTVVQLVTRPKLEVTELPGLKLPRPLFGHSAIRLE